MARQRTANDEHQHGAVGGAAHGGSSGWSARETTCEALNLARRIVWCGMRRRKGSFFSFIRRRTKGSPKRSAVPLAAMMATMRKGSTSSDLTISSMMTQRLAVMRVVPAREMADWYEGILGVGRAGPRRGWPSCASCLRVKWPVDMARAFWVLGARGHAEGGRRV